MFMFDRVLAITNRHLCQGDFLEQIERLAAAHPRGIVLREKDLPEADYEQLAAAVMEICARHGTPCILHHFEEVAARLHCENLHLPLPELLADPQAAQQAVLIGASVHSVEQAQAACQHGASYLTAGHVFETDCKAGLAPRGLDFLRAVCAAVPIPVYALGGITPENAADCLAAGAAGVAIMSGAMRSLDRWVL